jgi:hypothetical protein
VRNIDLLTSGFQIDHNPTSHISTDPTGYIENSAGPLAQIIGTIPRMVIDLITTLIHDPAQLEDLLLDAPEAFLEASLYTGLDNLGLGALGDLGDFIPGLGTRDIEAIAVTFITDILSPTGLLADIESIVGAITGLDPTGLGLEAVSLWAGNLEALLGGSVDLNSAVFDPLAAAESFVVNRLLPTNLFASWEELLQEVAGIATASDPLSVLGSVLRDGIFGAIPTWRLPLIPYTSIGDTQPNFLLNPLFLGSQSIHGGGIWTWDSTLYRTNSGSDSGSAKVSANGTLRVLRSNPIPVAEGQKLQIDTHVAWTGMVAGANPIQIGVEDNNSVDTVIDSVTLPGTVTSDWAAPPPGASFDVMTGTYTVPAGVDQIVIRLIVNATATAGTIWFGDASEKQIQPLDPGWILDLVPKIANLDLDGLFDASALTNIENIPAIAMASIIDLESNLASLLPISDWQDLLNGLYDKLNLTSGSTGIDLTQLLTAFQAIPSLLVTGVAGPSDIGGTAQSIIDQWISGVVGTIGVGAGLSDLFNLGADLSSKAFQGMLSWIQLGFRSDKPFWMGMLPTGVSNIPKPGLTSSTAPTIPITQSTAAMGYHVIDQPGTKGVVSWDGHNTAATNITAFFINIYKVDVTTGVHTLVHASPNIAGDIANAMGTYLYVLNNGAGTNTPLTVEQGDCYGIEFAIRGTGTYNILGAASYQTYDHPTAYPKRLASVRNSGTSAAPSTIAAASVVYSANIPFAEFAVSSGASNLHDAELRQFLTPMSTTTVAPTWANHAEVIVCGPGGDGYPGSSTPGVYGHGGGAGTWNAVTWDRGTHFNSGDTFSISVSLHGSPTTVSVGSNTVSGAPGFYASGWGTPHYGDSPGDFTYGTPAHTYSGGTYQYTLGGDGAAPGGGGAGGGYGFGFPGNPGTGAPGGVFIRFRQ